MKVRLFYDNNDNATKIQLLEDIKIDNFTIPKNFVSDGGSIPRLFHRLFTPLDARYIQAYVKHDYIYATGLTLRKQADKMLRDDLGKAGMWWINRNLIYLSVRLFGFFHYKIF